MKRTLIFTHLALLTLGAGTMLSTAAFGQSDQSPALVSSTSSTSGSGAGPACSPGAWQGHGHKGGKGGGGILEHLTNALQLSGSQQAEVASIIEAAKPQMKAIRDDAQSKRVALIESVSSQITPLLSPDQQTKFAEMVQKAETQPDFGGPAHFGHKGGFNKADAAGASGSPGPGHGEVLQRLTTELGLTADQQAQIKPLLDAAHTQMQSVRQDTTLPQDQKFAKIKDTMDSLHSQINGLLTADQQTKFAEMKARFRRNGPQGQPATPATSGTTAPASN